MRTWLVIDANYLCWRAYHSTGSLSWKGKPTGVIYGFLRDIETFRDLHGTDRFVFCFDHSRKHLKRRLDSPSYKCSRDAKLSKIESREYAGVHYQMNLLRDFILAGVGYRNILCKKGYEADDLIASTVGSLGKKEEAIIIGSDKDLYQLLGPKVIIFNPHTNRAITEDSFSREWGVTPIQWVDVKAIAGCSGDDVEGIKGVGEKTACKFLNGKLGSESVAFKSIVAGNKTWKRNRGLVKLPYPGTPVPKLRKDQRDDRAWKGMLFHFGITSLKGVSIRGKKKKRTR